MLNRYIAAVVTACALTGAAASETPAAAQVGKKLRDAARRAAEREAVRQVDRQVTQAVRCVLTDLACLESARAEGREVEIVDENGNPVTGAAGSVERPGEGAWANYDFLPGDRVLFVEDFSRDRVGNFPQRLDFVAGNLEIVEWRGKPLLRSTAESGFTIALGEPLPEQFTIELELLLGAPTWQAELITEPQRRHYDVTMYRGGSLFRFSRESGIAGRTGPTALTRTDLHETLVPVRIMVDGSYAKVFVGERRIANVPNAVLVRTDGVQLWLRGTEDRPSFISSIRIAAGGRKLYDALNEAGRVATQGIYFDTGSDRILPESTATLAEILGMLEKHGALRLLIEGHTDSVGDDASNQHLSERRAASVMQYLVAHGIDAARLEARGFGETRPAVTADTPEARQQNRRVELVRL
jgi:OmpA-OmpF porin, OOP family